MDSRWLEKAVALQNAGRVQEALKEYHALAEATVDSIERAMVILNEVNCLSDLGQATDARARLNDARALLPETSEFRVHAEFADACLDSLGIHVLSATYVLCGGCQVAEKDCRSRSLWVNLWVRILRVAADFELRNLRAKRCATDPSNVPKVPNSVARRSVHR